MKKIILSLSISLILGMILYFNSSNSLETFTLQQDSPERAALLDFDRMRDPVLNRIPFERYPVAISYMRQMQRLPHNTLQLSWTPIQSDMGGRTKVLCFDPNDPTHDKVWAGTATGGLWVNPHISDSQSAWIPVSDVWESLSVSSICFNPLNPQEMYIGTGEYETAITNIYRESSGRGYGIWKSTDGGQTFTRLLSTENFPYITDIAVKNENGNAVVYAGVVSGIYRGALFDPQPSEGLYRSFDGGQTWEQVLPPVAGTTLPYAPADIEITANGKIIIGSKRNRNNEGGGVILMSYTGNTGSWTIIDNFKNEIENGINFNIPGRVKVASAPSNSQKIYAFLAAQSEMVTIEGFPQTVGKFLVVSNDGGQTWQHQNIPDNYNSGKNWAYLAWHALSIEVDPLNENRIFAGGLDLNVSNDGGNTWSRISDWAMMYAGGGDNYIHADIHYIIYKPGSAGEMIFATDGGVFYTSDALSPTPVFQKRNKSFSTLQFYTVAINKNGPEYIAGGLQDNGTLLYTGNSLTETDMIQGGDGAFCQFDTDESIIISSTYDNKFFVTDYTLGQPVNWIYDYASGLFVSTFDYDAVHNTIWAIASDLHNNRLNEILKISDITNVANGSFIDLNTGTDKYFSAVRLIDDDNLLIGTANGKLYKVNHINTIPEATKIDQGVLPAGFISCIQTGDNGQRILLTVSNYGVASVWQSLDGGNSWTDVEGNLPDIPVRWALYHPADPDHVMVATETGVWTTDDINATNVVWIPQNNGFPNVRVDMLDVRPDNYKVVAGTHGRTLFTTTWDVAQGLEETEKVKDFKLYPNPAHDLVRVNLSEPVAKISIYDLNGKQVQQYKAVSGINRLDISSLSKGIYFIKINQTLKKLLVQ